MATLGPPSPTSPSRRRRKSFMRRCERYCCNVIIYFPLSFVYGLTSWAVWVEMSMAFVLASTSGMLPPRLATALLLIVSSRLLPRLPGLPLLRPPELVLYHCHLHRPRFPFYQRILRLPSHLRAALHKFTHREVLWRYALL